MRTVFLGLGSNLGEREFFLAEALRRLKEQGGVEVTAVSAVYETAPVGPPQDWYLNQVVQIRTGLKPPALLAVTQSLEREMGRTREVRWGPRTLDIDLLWWEGVHLQGEDLTIPHPCLWERDFMLIPLAELAPRMQDPHGVPLGERLALASLAGDVRLYFIPGLTSCSGRVKCLAETSSTMDVAWRWLEEDGTGGLVVAETQTGGRGRWGREWVSPPGVGLWFSLGFLILPDLLPYLNVAVTVAIRRVLAGISQAQVLIKWPNDLLLLGKKVGGLLWETRITEERKRATGKEVPVVLGVGLNINQEIVDFPLPLRETATSLHLATQKLYFRQGLLVRLLREIDAVLAHLQVAGMMEEWLAEYRHYCTTLGQKVRFAQGESGHLRFWEGEAVNITRSGELVLRLLNGEERAFASGEIVHLRQVSTGV